MNTNDSQPTILHLGTDLMIASSIGEVARQNQVVFRSLTTADRLIEKLAIHRRALAIINLQLPNLDIAELGKRLFLPAFDSTTVVWFSQHVYEDLLEAGLNTGIGTVMTRGQLSRKLPELVSGWLDTTPPNPVN